MEINKDRELTTKDYILVSIGTGIFILLIPLYFVYKIIKMFIIMPKYGVRMAFMKCWKEEEFEKEERERAEARNYPWPTDPVERAKMPRLKLPNKNQYEFSTYANMSSFELVYVASKQDELLEDMLANNIDYFNRWAAPMKMRVLYLPSLFKEIVDNDVIDYRDPSKKHHLKDYSPVGNDYLLQYLIHPEDREIMKSGFLWNQKDVRKDHHVDTHICYFFPLSSSSDLSIEQQLARIKDCIYEKARWLGRSFNRVIRNEEEEEKENFADYHFNSQYAFYQVSWENNDDLIAEIKERVLKLRKRGIAQHILEELIKPDDSPSKLVITKDYRLLLPAYNDMEIKMEPLVKAVYLLFLKHPEGILFKHLPDYRQELMEIYSKLRPNGLSDKAIKSIEDVTNPLLNSINEKCARIRGAFVGQFDNHLARYYYIDGERAQEKKIALPRDLVVWE